MFMYLIIKYRTSDNKSDNFTQKIVRLLYSMENLHIRI